MFISEKNDEHDFNTNIDGNMSKSVPLPDKFCKQETGFYLPSFRLKKNHISIYGCSCKMDKYCQTICFKALLKKQYHILIE